jgi:hypothetical protein
MGGTPTPLKLKMDTTNPADLPPSPAVTPEVQSPFCGELRSKKFFMLDVLPTEEEQFLDSTQHCWCCQTQQVVGPDGLPVHPTSCTPSRACYVNSLNAFT